MMVKLSLVLLAISSTFCENVSPIIRPYNKDADQKELIALIEQNPEYF